MGLVCSCTLPRPDCATIDTLAGIAEKVEAEETSAEPAEPAEESAQPAEAAEDPAKEDGALTGAHNGKLLTGAVFVAIVLGVALVAGIVLVRRRRSLNYSKLHTETDQLRRGTTSQLSEP